MHNIRIIFINMIIIIIKIEQQKIAAAAISDNSRIDKMNKISDVYIIIKNIFL